MALGRPCRTRLCIIKVNGQFQLSRGRGALAMNDDDDDDDETRGEVSFKLVRGLRKSFPSLSFFFAKLASGIRNDGERSLLYE